MRIKRSMLVVLLCVLSAGVFLPALNGGLVWDDINVQYHQLPHIATVKESFFPPPGIPEFSTSYYRPIVLVSYLVDRFISGAMPPSLQTTYASAVVPHLSNLVFHVCTSLVVLVLAGLVFGKSEGSLVSCFVAASFFALHPAHVESVCSIAGRSDILATLFTLGAVLLLYRYLQTGFGPTVLGGLVAFSFGMLSKEVSIVAPVLLLLVVESRPGSLPPATPGSRLRVWVVASGMALVVSAYLFLRRAAGMGFGGSTDLSVAEGVDHIFRALSFYVAKTAFPWPRQHFVPQLPSLSYAMTVLLMGLAGVAGILKALPRHRRVVVVGCVLFLVALAPALLLSFRPLAVTPLAERYLYLPAVGAALIAAALHRGLGQLHPLHRAYWNLAMFSCLAAFAVSSIAGSLSWRSNVAFWESLERQSSLADHPVVLGNLGDACTEAGLFSKARDVYSRGLRREYGVNLPAYIDMVQRLGELCRIEADQLLRAANYGAALNKANEGIPLLEMATRNPGRDYPFAFASLGGALLVKALAEGYLTKQPNFEVIDRARENLVRSMTLNPGDPFAGTLLAECDAAVQQLLSAEGPPDRPVE
ncbi:MAG: glycosyltransferase family 39 protein [Deltaproteobacteria bacterium]|nr:glycosyltransferase family 39 protein [Deltaproteobacteria bacterium]